MRISLHNINYRRNLELENKLNIQLTHDLLTPCLKQYYLLLLRQLQTKYNTYITSLGVRYEPTQHIKLLLHFSPLRITKQFAGSKPTAGSANG